MEKISKFSRASPSGQDQANDVHSLVRKAASAPAKKPPPQPPLVNIGSDYPSEAALSVMRELKIPKLKKITVSLF